MDISEAILKEHTKENTENIVSYIGAEEGKIKKFMQLFLNDEYRVVQRAAWVLSGIAKQHPKLIQPYIEILIQKLNDKNAHDAVKRNILRFLPTMDYPETSHSELMNFCFDALMDVHQPIAIRVFAMNVLEKLAVTYPEINQELKIILEDNLEHGASAGFISRAKKILKKMK